MDQLSKENVEAGHKIAMQVAAMKPVALDEASVPQSVKDEEFKVAVEKTKEEMVEKAVIEIADVVLEEGKRAVLESGVDMLPSEIIKLLR